MVSQKTQTISHPSEHSPQTECIRTCISGFEKINSQSKTACYSTTQKYRSHGERKEMEQDHPTDKKSTHIQIQPHLQAQFDEYEKYQ